MHISPWLRILELQPQTRTLEAPDSVHPFLHTHVLGQYSPGLDIFLHDPLFINSELGELGPWCKKEEGGY